MKYPEAQLNPKSNSTYITKSPRFTKMTSSIVSNIPPNSTHNNHSSININSLQSISHNYTFFLQLNGEEICHSIFLTHNILIKHLPQTHKKPKSYILMYILQSGKERTTHQEWKEQEFSFRGSMLI